MHELGIQPKRSLGQNFLISSHVIGKIIQAVKRMQPEAILEIGPGLGALTDELIQLDVPLQLIEMDRKFIEYWKGRGLSVHGGDALALDWTTLPLTTPTVLVSNLPYQISASIVIDRCLGPDSISSMVLMFQKEVAQRIKAPARGEHYGLLSVLAQVFWKVDLVLEASSKDFYPPPKVASRVLEFNRLTDLGDLNRKAFLQFVKGAFSNRRKLLVKNLTDKPILYKIERTWLENQLIEMGHSAMARAEELSPKEFLDLFRKVEDFYGH